MSSDKRNTRECCEKEIILQSVLKKKKKDFELTKTQCIYDFISFSRFNFYLALSSGFATQHETRIRDVQVHINTYTVFTVVCMFVLVFDFGFKL